MVEIFSTNRGVREFYSAFSEQNAILPKSITIADFESRAIIIENRIFIDNDTRFLLLHEASDFKDFKKLQFDQNFLIFLNHSKYLFGLFEELANENITIDDIRNLDFYAEYEEHLDILEFLLNEYKRLLDTHSYVDKINLQDLYKLNEDYISSLDEIHIRIDGFLSSFETDLFLKTSQIIPVYLSFELNNYNSKLKKTFEKLGFELTIGHYYMIDLSNGKILEQRKTQDRELNAKIRVFNARLAQVGFIFSSIAEFVKDGLKPEDIVVVLPDESFAPFLKKFDKSKNLNFAMGFSLRNSKLYKRIEAIELYATKREDEDKLRLKRLQIPDELISKIDDVWRKKLDFSESISIINEICALEPKEAESEKFQEIIFRFSNFLSKIKLYSLEQILKLFLNRLSNESEDDISGGNITVLGLLETRGSSFKGVIVPDFNDSFVPKINNKDLFLNTKIRNNLSLPTINDRENLQRYYYHKLFSSAQKISISCLQNELEMPSRFLDELGLKYKNLESGNSYNINLFKRSAYSDMQTYKIENVSYELDQYPLSATKLNTLLTCRRKFYYRYIQKIDDPKNATTESNAKIGLLLHNALDRAFSDQSILGDEKRLHELLAQSLHKDISNTLDKFYVDVWLENLKKFAKNESERYIEGYRIYKKEESLSLNFSGFNLYGKIDRIDKNDNQLYVIDYKSGDTKDLLKKNLETDNNFQLEFYYILASSLGNVDSAYYYDLKEGKLLEEVFLNEKVEILKNILKDFKKPITEFDLCEKESNCVYCPYNKICLRQN
ncbi:MAG: PD-(D/E)XK nuclease family protein [Sulfurospirillaceae bacterium]|nr:PD-(D/E)XK nuclease family protein [Sulfurospirillaceae bacterium]